MWQRLAVVGTVSAAALVAAVCSWNDFSSSGDFADGAYESDSMWGTRWAGAPEFIPFATDGFGGVNEVEIRKLEDDSPGDVVGITKPGCLVQGTKSYGPVYRVDGGDADKLPKVGLYNGTTKKDGEYMPWFYVEVPAYERAEDGQFKPRVDSGGHAIILRGYIRGANLKDPRFAKVCQ